MTTLYILIAATIVFLCIGIYFSKKIKSSADFNVTGWRMSAPLIGASIVATYMSTSTYLGFSGLIYAQGLGVFAIALSAGLALGVAGVLLIGPLRRLKTITIPEFIGKRYDSSVARGVAALLVFVITLCIGGATTIGFSLLISSLTGIPYQAAILVALIVSVVYVVLGGLLAAYWTDALSLVAMLVLVVIGIPYVLSSAGGFGNVFSTLGEQGWLTWDGATGALSGDLLVGQLILWIFGGAVLPYVFSRGFSARSRKAAIQGFALGFPLYTLVAIIPITMVVGATRILRPNIENTDTAFIVMGTELMPAILGPVMLFVIMLAGLTSINDMLVVSGQSVAVDVYKGMLARDAGERLQLLVSRLMVLASSIVVLGIAFWRPAQIFFVASYAVQLSAAGLFIPIIAGIYWRGSTREGAIAAMIGGPLTIVLTSFVSLDWMGPLGHVVVPGMIVAAVLFFGVSLAMKGRISHEALAYQELARQQR